MPVLQQPVRRFQELEAQIANIKWRQGSGGLYASADEWRQWATSAMHLIRAAFGENSPHYTNFRASYERCTGHDHNFAALTGIFRGARADYEGGYVFSVEASISGEILGDFVAMAKLALADGYKDVVAVLACAALEDTLKRFARLNGLNVDDKGLQEVVASLKSKGLVAGAQKSLLDVMPKIRDFAMHANWDKIQDADVRSVLGFVEQLLLTRFGSDNFAVERPAG